MPPRGQTWTTLPALQQSHMNAFHEYDTGIIGIGAGFAIGQRALLVQTEGGNLLWDCVATLDPATVSLIKGLGGLKAIAISHPHFYTTMNEWAQAFGCPIHLHAADQEWIMRKGPAIKELVAPSHVDQGPVSLRTLCCEHAATDRRRIPPPESVMRNLSGRSSPLVQRFFGFEY